MKEKHLQWGSYEIPESMMEVKQSIYHLVMGEELHVNNVSGDEMRKSL